MSIQHPHDTLHDGKHHVQAAWKELERPSVSPESTSGIAEASSSRPAISVRISKAGHAREMAHHLQNLAGMEADTVAESTINAEMAALLLARLAAGRSALEASHRFVQSLHAAEAHMAQALFATKGAALGCESDGAVLHRVHATVTVMPSSLAASHARRAKALRGMVLTLSEAAAMFAGSHGTLERGLTDVNDMMRGRRARLSSALSRHEVTCADVDRCHALQVCGAAAAPRKCAW